MYFQQWALADRLLGLPRLMIRHKKLSPIETCLANMSFVSDKENFKPYHRFYWKHI